MWSGVVLDILPIVLQRHLDIPRVQTEYHLSSDTLVELTARHSVTLQEFTLVVLTQVLRQPKKDLLHICEYKNIHISACVSKFPYLDALWRLCQDNSSKCSATQWRRVSTPLPIYTSGSLPRGPLSQPTPISGQSLHERLCPLNLRLHPHFVLPLFHPRHRLLRKGEGIRG